MNANAGKINVMAATGEPNKGEPGVARARASGNAAMNSTKGIPAKSAETNTGTGSFFRSARKSHPAKGNIPNSASAGVDFSQEALIKGSGRKSSRRLKPFAAAGGSAMLS